MRINQEMIDFHQQNIRELYKKASGAEMIPQTATSWHRQLLKKIELQDEQKTILLTICPLR